MIASVNKPRAHNQPFTLTPAKHEPTVTISPNPLCKPNTSSHQLQLINLNKQTKATNCSPLKTINLMSPKPAKSNLLTTVDKLDAFSAADEDTFLSKLCEPEPAPSSMLDDSLTSLQWLQSLNIMKNASLPATTCSLSPHSHTSDKAQPSLDCDLDSATVPAAKSGDKHALNPSYPPLSPPLSVHCSASPQSTCSSNTSTKRRSKKAHSKTMQHQVSAPAILQPSKSQSIMANSASTSATLFRNSFLKDRHEYRTNADVKPPYSYSQLIILSMKESKQSKMTLQMIYDWIIGNFSYFKKAEPNWQVTFKNSIRHNLSLNKCFRKIARQKDEPGKGGFWTLDPEFERQLDESNSLGSPPVNAKCYKRKRKSGDGDEAKKRPRPDPVQYSEMENCDFVRSDANLSQVNKPPQTYAYMESGPAYMGHVNEPVAACNHFDFGESFAGSFSSHGMGYMKNFEDESGLFGFEANLPTLELDQFTDSSCTSSSSPDDLVGGLLKKSSSLAVAHDTELSELFDITSQFGLDEGFSATSLINSGGEKRPVDLTVQGTGIRQPKWWPDSLLDLDTGLMGVQAQDDECDSGMCALDFGLNVDDLDFLSVESAVTTQQQQQQQARKRIYTHQSKLNPATHKTCKTKPAF